MDKNIFQYIKEENDINRLKETLGNYTEVLISEIEYFKKEPILLNLYQAVLM